MNDIVKDRIKEKFQVQFLLLVLYKANIFLYNINIIQRRERERDVERGFAMHSNSLKDILGHFQRAELTTHIHSYIHTQTHSLTYTHAITHIHTHTYNSTHTHIQIHKHKYFCFM